MMVVIGLVAAVFLQCVSAQTAHVVGGSIGWIIPQNGAQEYTTWASGQKFLVGDVLIFNFVTDTHDVLEVPKASFDLCSSTNPIGSTITTGPANVTLTAAGDHYYIALSVATASPAKSSPSPSQLPPRPPEPPLLPQLQRPQRHPLPQLRPPRLHPHLRPLALLFKHHLHPLKPRGPQLAQRQDPPRCRRALLPLLLGPV